MKTPGFLKNKPLVLKKMLQYCRNMKAGEYALQLLELNYDTTCNFHCSHCYVKNLGMNEKPLTMEELASLADQAHSLGVWQWHLQGGEPLMWSNLHDIIQVIDPKRFHFFITSNGWFMTDQKASILSGLGVDRVSISLDSLDPDEHDRFRQKKGSFARALKALETVSRNGMQANINVCVTHENATSERLIDLIEFAGENNYSVLCVVAVPIGAWAGRADVLITEDDAEYLKELKTRYPFIHRDLYPIFDFEWGCRTMNGLVYITPEGDLLSCPFIHIKIGNVKEEPLARILERGYRVKCFRDFSSKCLAGEDRHFINKYLPQEQESGRAVPFENVFSEDDLYD